MSDSAPDRGPLFLPLAGRRMMLERLRHAVKRAAPPAALRLARAVLRPGRGLRARAERWPLFRRALPRPLGAQVHRLWTEAHARWWSGQTRATGPDVRLPLGRSNHYVWVRPGTSDVLVYHDVVLREQYSRIAPGDVRTVVDCGANVGLTSAYLLSRYPASRVIAIEPDAANVAQCEKNLAQFGSRAVVLRAALCASPRMMSVVPSSHAGTWASTVRPAGEDPGADLVEGIDIPTLLERYRIATVDVLKMDIEGAEAEIFASAPRDWLRRVRCIQIELENETSASAFFGALAGEPVKFFRSGDVVIALRTDGR